MIQVVVKQGKGPPAGRAVGLLYVGIDALYSIIARYSSYEHRARDSELIQRAIIRARDGGKPQILRERIIQEGRL